MINLADATLPVAASNAGKMLTESISLFNRLDFIDSILGAVMKRFGLVLLATVGLASLAQAADLPTKKAVEAPKPNCWASVWTWLNTSADDCPISAYGITLYGTLDVGLGYESWGTTLNPSADKNNYGIQKSGHGGIWLPTYNGLSSSVIGLKMKEDLAPLG